MNKHKTTALAAALLLGLGGMAFAAEGEQTTPPASTQSSTQSTQSDSTHGDTVSGVARSQNELRQETGVPPVDPPGSTVSQVAQAQGDWNQLDLDGDGILSDAEIQADANLSAQVDMLDTDGDGQLTRTEFDAQAVASTDTDLGMEDEEFE